MNNSYYVTAMDLWGNDSRKNLVRGCIVQIPDDYSFAKDAPHFKQLRALFAEAVKSRCTCRAEWEHFTPDRTVILSYQELKD